MSTLDLLPAATRTANPMSRCRCRGVQQPIGLIFHRVSSNLHMDFVIGLRYSMRRMAPTAMGPLMSFPWRPCGSLKKPACSNRTVPTLVWSISTRPLWERLRFSPAKPKLELLNVPEGCEGWRTNKGNTEERSVPRATCLLTGDPNGGVTVPGRNYGKRHGNNC